ncbi:MAG: dihydroneopterin aldolase [Pseudomonadota bacterium]
MDKIFLRGLAIDAVVGIWDWERKIEQKVVVDLEMATDIAKAARSDSIDDTLNYKAVAERVREYVVTEQALLVESLAEGIARVVTSEFDVPWVKVTVNKPGAIRGSDAVGIEIERSKPDA